MLTSCLLFRSKQLLEIYNELNDSNAVNLKYLLYEATVQQLNYYQLMKMYAQLKFNLSLQYRHINRQCK